LPTWSKLQRGRAELSDQEFKAGLKPYERDSCDSDYVEDLPEAERVWMRNFQAEYHGARFAPGGKHLNKGENRRECQRRVRGHAGDRRPDLLSYGMEHNRVDMEEASSLPAPGGGEDEMIDHLDAKRFAEWQYRRRDDIAAALRLNRQLRRSRWLLRQLKALRDPGAKSAALSAAPALGQSAGKTEGPA
jgi:hypothetical protein